MGRTLISVIVNQKKRNSHVCILSARVVQVNGLKRGILLNIQIMKMATPP